MRAVINNNITDLSYPVTLVDFKTTKIDFKTAKSAKDADEYKPGRFAQIFLDSVNKTHFLASLKASVQTKHHQLRIVSPEHLSILLFLVM